MSKTLSKIVYLDGVRGVAAFFVFMHHFGLAFFPSYYSFDPKTTNIHGLEINYGQSFFSFITDGNFFVYVFFVLSGYVLSRRYYRTGDLSVVISGAHRRFLRLYIPVATTMIIAYLMMKAHLFYNVPVSVLRHSEWWLGGMWTFHNELQVLWRCLTFTTMFQYDSSFDTTLWTMTVELMFSFFVFGFLALTHNSRRRGLVLFLVLLYSWVTNQATLATFVLGISLNYIEQAPAILNKYLLNAIAAALLLFSLFLGSYPTIDLVKDTAYEHLGSWFMDYKSWFHYIGAYLFIIPFVISTPLQWFMSLRLFRFLGRVSFALYLLHPLLIGSFGCFLYLHWHVALGFNKAVIYVFILTSLLGMVLSWLMTKYVDDPGVTFSKYVYDRWFKKKPLTTAAAEAIAD